MTASSSRCASWCAATSRPRTSSRSANETDADLIVIGLRRRTPVGKLILGSNAQRILLDAPCAVLAVKGRPDERPSGGARRHPGPLKSRSTRGPFAPGDVLEPASPLYNDERTWSRTPGRARSGRPTRVAQDLPRRSRSPTLRAPGLRPSATKGSRCRLCPRTTPRDERHSRRSSPTRPCSPSSAGSHRGLGDRRRGGRGHARRRRRRPPADRSSCARSGSRAFAVAMDANATGVAAATSTTKKARGAVSTSTRSATKTAAKPAAKTAAKATATSRRPRRPPATQDRRGDEDRRGQDRRHRRRQQGPRRRRPRRPRPAPAKGTATRKAAGAAAAAPANAAAKTPPRRPPPRKTAAATKAAGQGRR